MAQEASQRKSRSKQSQRKQPDSRTKFDVWLEGHVSTGELVEFLVKQHPIIPESGLAHISAKIFTVDRYHVYMEIEALEDTPVWVAKDNIISAA